MLLEKDFYLKLQCLCIFKGIGQFYQKFWCKITGICYLPDLPEKSGNSELKLKTHSANLNKVWRLFFLRMKKSTIQPLYELFFVIFGAVISNEPNSSCYRQGAKVSRIFFQRERFCFSRYNNLVLIFLLPLVNGKMAGTSGDHPKIGNFLTIFLKTL